MADKTIAVDEQFTKELNDFRNSLGLKTQKHALLALLINFFAETALVYKNIISITDAATSQELPVPTLVEYRRNQIHKWLELNEGNIYDILENARLGLVGEEDKEDYLKRKHGNY